MLVLSCVRLFAAPWALTHQASLCFTISQNLPKLMSMEWVMSSNHLILYWPVLSCPSLSHNLLKFMSIESVMLSNHLILRCPLPLLLSIFPSIRVFSNESAFHIRWPKYWSISTSNKYSGLISFQFSSVSQLCLILCNSMNCSTPGLSVHHQLPELTNTQIH